MHASGGDQAQRIACAACAPAALRTHLPYAANMATWRQRQTPVHCCRCYYCCYALQPHTCSCSAAVVLLLVKANFLRMRLRHVRAGIAALFVSCPGQPCMIAGALPCALALSACWTDASCLIWLRRCRAASAAAPVPLLLAQPLPGLCSSTNSGLGGSCRVPSGKPRGPLP